MAKKCWERYAEGVYTLELVFCADVTFESSSEADLLAYPATHAGEVRSRETIFQQLLRHEYDGMDRTLDLRISQLRRKLGDDADTSPRIKTIWGQGYLFVPDAW